MDDAVARAIERSADLAIVPRFQSLSASDIQEKQPGDYVTVADQECEALIERALSVIDPGVPVLGEEAAAADPDLAGQLLASERLWVVDPLDGTRAFIEGNPDFAVMVALIEQGQTRAAWIYHPIERVMWSARRGEGTRRQGELVKRLRATSTNASLRGLVKTGFMDAAMRTVVENHREDFASIDPGPASAGFAYPQVIEGGADFVMFWRTLPWDHAPGALLAQEAGCHVARLDGSAYRPQQTTPGLLIASDPEAWSRIQTALFPLPPPTPDHT